MSLRTPEADSYQQAAWIAFSRLEQRHTMATEHPTIVSKLGYRDADHFLSATEKCLFATVDEILPLLLMSDIAPTMTAREICCAFFLKRQHIFSMSVRNHSTHYQTIRNYIPYNSPLHFYSIYLECRRSNYQGHAGEIAELLCAFRADVPVIEAGVMSIWCETLFDFVQAEAAFMVGDFKSAHVKLTRVFSTASGLNFGCANRSQLILAKLLRETGQPEQALQIWQDGDLRNRLVHTCDWTTLAVNYLNSAQCALDSKLADIARTELEAASELIPDVSTRDSRLQGYQYLREGELATLEERYEDGERLLRQALDFFRTVEPPCHEGLLETKIALGTYALFQDDMRMAWAIIRSLIEEASERGCFPMRSRALLLQTWFFISSDPPTRAAFDNVLERIHMIQNPALMMHALGNLLSYAVNHLEESDRDHLLHRIRGLQGVLEESCYEKLYEQHVTSRFAPAMEERFERKSDENDPEYMVENG